MISEKNINPVEALRTYMSDEGLNQKELAVRLGWSQSALNNVLSGREPLGIKRLLHISLKLGLHFKEVADNYVLPGEPIPPPLPGSIPVVSLAQGGPKGFYDDMGYPVGEGFRKLKRPYDLTDPHAYGVEVCGDSMFPKFEEKDIVVVSPQKEVHNGNYAVVRLKSGELMVKRVRYKDGLIILESINPAYEPCVIKKHEMVFAHKIVWVKPKG